MPPTDPLFQQRFLKASGFYSGALDGVWGPRSIEATQTFQQASKAIALQEGSFDAVSEAQIITLLPEAQRLCRSFLRMAMEKAGDVKVLSGTRTYSQQDQLFRKGRFGNQEPKVTNARGGYSHHNFGLAWDIGIFQQGRYVQVPARYRELAVALLPHFDRLEWGGHWIQFPDPPHFQLRPRENSLSAVRALFEKGSPYV